MLYLQMHLLAVWFPFLAVMIGGLLKEVVKTYQMAQSTASHGLANGTNLLLNLPTFFLSLSIVYAMYLGLSRRSHGRK
jgi:hypothetical protein